jgi:ABC-2 type transport system ATP-binding protein
VAAGVRNLVSRPPTLEELFLRHYAAAPAAEAASPAAGDADAVRAEETDLAGGGATAGPAAGDPDAGRAEAGAPAAAGQPRAAGSGSAGTRP